MRWPNQTDTIGLVQEKLIIKIKKSGVDNNQNRSKPEIKLKNVEFENAE